MAITTDAGGTTITGEHVEMYRIMAIRRGLRLEIRTGMKMSRHTNLLAAANAVMGTNHRTKRKAFEELNARMVAAGMESLSID